MGVTQLWQVLGPVEQHVPLSSLNGQTLAVDLSIWVCENQNVKQMQGVVAKPFLRNLFFRISHLTQLGVKLVFVIEGTAPELKWDTMVKRQQTRFPGRPGKQSPRKQAGKQTRRNFNSWLKECCELLEIMGIPYIQSKGEAEALCALLNAAGLVDGCLTNDGDAFLYGAKRVYRNFTMNSKDPHVDMFDMNDIESKLCIDRRGLIALGLLVGCDFVPKGVPGIGVANSVRLLQSLQGQDVLTRLQLWKSMAEKDCVDQVEVLARKKAIQVPEFPQTKVIDEFLVVKDRCPSQLPQWKRPVLAKLQEFALIKLEWPVEYTLEKVLPLMTLWDMLDILHSRNPSVHQHLKPHRIVKTRVRQGEPCFEVEWHKPVTESVNEDIYYVTIETQELFSKCYPEIVKAFESETSDNKKKSKAKKKKKKQPQAVNPPADLDSLAFKFEKINLKAVTSDLQRTVKELHPSFSDYVESHLTTKAKQPKHLTLNSSSKKPISKTSVDSRTEIADCVVSPFASSLKNEQKDHKMNRSDKNQEEEQVMSLSQRVKLRMKNKTENSKDSTSVIAGNVKYEQRNSGVAMDSTSSLLKGVQSISLNEPLNKKNSQEAQSGFGTKLKISEMNSPKMQTPSSLISRKQGMKDNTHRMSSPACDAFSSPMSYMKHKWGLGDSFEIQRSPYYIEYPASCNQKQRTSTNGLDINSPGYFSRRKSDDENKVVDKRSTAEKLAEKLESGIQQVGHGVLEGKNVPSMFGRTKPTNSNDDQIALKSLQSLLNSTNGSILTPTNSSNKTSSRLPDQSVLDSTNLSSFGDFQLQNSLMNSLCSSLVQALTPKGVSMTKTEYEQLVATLNELESDENTEENDLDVDDGDEVANSIDLAEIEKVSKNLTKISQNLLLRPIQIDDEDVMSKLSKSARKKLRRKERKIQEMENMVKIQNMSLNKQKLNKKQKSDLKTRLSHSNDDMDGTKRKKPIICSPSKDSRAYSIDSRNKGGQKRNPYAKDDNRSTKDSPVSDTKTDKIQNERKTSTEIKHSNGTGTKISENVVQNKVTVTDPEGNEVKKKKKRKKKVKKASPLIDLSGNDSLLDDSKVAVCSQYLKRALENTGKMSRESKVPQASPVMKLSADNALLELEGISCKIVGEELDSDFKTKWLKQKKLLQKSKTSVIESVGEEAGTDPVFVSPANVKDENDDLVESDEYRDKIKAADDIEKLEDVNDIGHYPDVQLKCSCMCSLQGSSKVMVDQQDINTCTSKEQVDIVDKDTDHGEMQPAADYDNEEVSAGKDDAGTLDEEALLCENEKTKTPLSHVLNENLGDSNKWCYESNKCGFTQKGHDNSNINIDFKNGDGPQMNGVSGYDTKDIINIDDDDDDDGDSHNNNIGSNNADDVEHIAASHGGDAYDDDDLNGDNCKDGVKCISAGELESKDLILDVKGSVTSEKLDLDMNGVGSARLGAAESKFDAEEVEDVTQMQHSKNIESDNNENTELERSLCELTEINTNGKVGDNDTGKDAKGSGMCADVLYETEFWVTKEAEKTERSLQSNCLGMLNHDSALKLECDGEIGVEHCSSNIIGSLTTVRASSASTSAENSPLEGSGQFNSAETNHVSELINIGASVGVDNDSDDVSRTEKHTKENSVPVSLGQHDSMFKTEAFKENTFEQEDTESPACLADRLKLKLKQKSTRNLLDSFTNWK